MCSQIVSDTPCTCRDCGQPMDLQHQALLRGGFAAIVTCWNPKCLLATVTLSVEQYNNLTECQFEAYREMNRTRALGRHATDAALEAVAHG